MCSYDKEINHAFLKFFLEVLKLFIYTFWEPRTNIPYYLQLCMETWKKFLPNATIVVLDYKNIGEFIDVRELGLNLFSGRFSLPMIADAIRVALLAKYGGVWMDIDTIILNSSAEKYLLPDDKHKTIFFGHHMAFINTPPCAVCMKLWVNYIREKIWELTPATKIEWSFMGNDFISAYINAHPDEMKILDANIHKPELKIINDALKKIYPVNPYLGNTDLILLHNSWTPAAYKQWSPQKILRCDCTMSNILAEALEIRLLPPSERFSFDVMVKK